MISGLRRTFVGLVRCIVEATNVQLAEGYRKQRKMTASSRVVKHSGMCKLARGTVNLRTSISTDKFPTPTSIAERCENAISEHDPDDQFLTLPVGHSPTSKSLPPKMKVKKRTRTLSTNPSRTHQLPATRSVRPPESSASEFLALREGFVGRAALPGPLLTGLAILVLIPPLAFDAPSAEALVIDVVAGEMAVLDQTLHSAAAGKVYDLVFAHCGFGGFLVQIVSGNCKTERGVVVKGEYGVW